MLGTGERRGVRAIVRGREGLIHVHGTDRDDGRCLVPRVSLNRRNVFQQAEHMESLWNGGISLIVLGQDRRHVSTIYAIFICGCVAHGLHAGGIKPQRTIDCQPDTGSAQDHCWMQDPADNLES